MAENTSEKKIIHANDISFRVTTTNYEHNIKSYPVTNFPTPSKPIAQKLVHKNCSENVLVTDSIILNENLRIYRVKILPPFKDKTFFDHAYDHIPGMVIIEACRQLGTALCHKHLNIGYENEFIFEKMETHFFKFASLKNETYIDAHITKIDQKNNKIRKADGIGYIHQNNILLGTISFSTPIVSKKIIARLKL